MISDLVITPGKEGKLHFSVYTLVLHSEFHSIPIHTCIVFCLEQWGESDTFNYSIRFHGNTYISYSTVREKRGNTIYLIHTCIPSVSIVTTIILI